MKFRLLLFSFVVLLSCKQTKTNYQEVRGNAQGTTFFVSYKDSLKRDFSEDIATILQEFDEELNIYLPTSVVSKFNNNTLVLPEMHKHKYFLTCMYESSKIKELTNGYFDHGMKNIIDFSKNKTSYNLQDSLVIDSILKISHFIIPMNNFFVKNEKIAKFDFNAIAQGYSVDVLGDFLVSKGVENYMVEIGGELKVKGKNFEGNKWSVGLESPKSTIENREFQEIIYLENKSLATSGSYRKFKEINGKKYSHVINPKTGFGVTHNLLSITVITDDCISADALATAFLVMGKEKTIQLIKDKKELKDVAVYFIEATEKEEFTTSFYNGFDAYLKK